LARLSAIFTFRLATGAIALGAALLVSRGAFAQPMGGGPQMGPTQGDGQPWAGYQRKGFDNGPGFGGAGPGWNGAGRGGGYGYSPQQFSGGYIQRPYPYHLDYYKMRYGGSYAPYYGNLYGQSNSFYPAQYNGDYGPNYYGQNETGPNNTNNGPPTGNESAGGHWAWCWVPDASNSTTAAESLPSGTVQPTSKLP
jgi:hypothetical protein